MKLPGDALYTIAKNIKMCHIIVKNNVFHDRIKVKYSLKTKNGTMGNFMLRR